MRRLGKFSKLSEQICGIQMARMYTVRSATISVQLKHVFAFIALTLLVGREEGHLAVKT